MRLFYDYFISWAGNKAAWWSTYNAVGSIPEHPGDFRIPGSQSFHRANLSDCKETRYQDALPKLMISCQGWTTTRVAEVCMITKLLE
jgi:hypothetical protein